MENVHRPRISTWHFRNLMGEEAMMKASKSGKVGNRLYKTYWKPQRHWASQHQHWKPEAKRFPTQNLYPATLFINQAWESTKKLWNMRISKNSLLSREATAWGAFTKSNEEPKRKEAVGGKSGFREEKVIPRTMAKGSSRRTAVQQGWEPGPHGWVEKQRAPKRMDALNLRKERKKKKETGNVIGWQYWEEFTALPEKRGNNWWEIRRGHRQYPDSLMKTFPEVAHLNTFLNPTRKLLWRWRRFSSAFQCSYIRVEVRILWPGTGVTPWVGIPGR